MGELALVVTERIEYKVIEADGEMEIRAYPRIVLATVYALSDNDAFGILFEYIQGHNRSKRRISMTVPVISSERIAMTAPVISTDKSFSFVLPSTFTAETAPEPLDERVRIEAFPERRVAVVRFRGRANYETVSRKAAELLAFVRARGLEPRGKPFLMRYNPPFVPGLLRRNEVAVELSS